MKLKSLKRTNLAIFFLLCFTCCISLNAARNIRILAKNPGAWKTTGHSSLSLEKRSPGNAVYFLMDKKENDSQKQTDLHVNVLPAPAEHINSSIYPSCKVSPSKYFILIYIAVCNYRI